MGYTAYQNYLENEVLTAEPLKLVVLLYRGALDSVGAARRYLEAKDIGQRSKSLNKALSILKELNLSLDMERGGPLSVELARLYDYMLRLLLEASVKQTDAPLEEAEQLLRTLLEAWEQCRENGQTPVDDLCLAHDD